MSLAKEVGRILRRARGEASLRDQAERVNLAVSTVYELEQGQNNPTLARLERIGEAYRLTFHVTAEEHEPEEAGDARR